MSDVIFIIGLFCVFALYILTRSSQMNDIEIVVFQDKSWVRLTEYQKVKEENERLKEQIDKMKCCSNCNGKFLSTRCSLCKDKSKWELAE